MTKGQMFDRLTELGVAKAVLSFSGGNDEGGVDNAVYFNADHEQMPLELTRTYEEHVFEDGKWIVKPEADPEQAKTNELVEQMHSPIYDQWGSFAGDFYVEGRLTIDVVKRTSEMTGQERVEVYEQFGGEV